jgi:hypothetical protein
MRTKLELPSFPKVDKRLLGTWKSDARRTLKDWRWKKSLSPKRIKKCKTIFGKSEAIFTKTKVISRLSHRNWESVRRYAVLGADKNSVAIIEFGELEIKNRKKYEPLTLEFVEELSQPRITHIHFVDDYYWISYGKNREFFRKISGAMK